MSEPDNAPFDAHEEVAEEAIHDADLIDEERSFTEDLNALYEDGRLYVDAELAYQKKRAGFAAGNVKGGVVFGLAALGLLHLSLIALTVGAVIALAPILTALGATLAVGGVLLLIAALAGWMAVRRFSKAGSVFGSSDKGDAQ